MACCLALLSNDDLITEIYGYRSVALTSELQRLIDMIIDQMTVEPPFPFPGSSFVFMDLLEILGLRLLHGGAAEMSVSIKHVSVHQWLGFEKGIDERV
jgi:hypothetical protein